MIRAGIIGATGYAGAELARLLSQRDDVSIVWYGSRSYVGEDFSSIYRNMPPTADMVCKDEDMAACADIADVIFTATPQGYCASSLTEDILSRCKVIDLSADYRLRDVNIYEKWYGMTHASPQLIDEAAYGLPEINRDKIKASRLIANPGCYPTASILAVYPLLKAGLIEPQSIIVDAKSGVSGAGRSAKTANLYCEVNESIKAYGVGTHRHTPEIEQELTGAAGKDVVISFTPHLVPMDRGILITAYASLTPGTDARKLQAAYEDFFGGEYFIRLLPYGTPPETRWVRGSNFADVSCFLDERTGRAVMMSAIDNMVKGAAGQAIQNMNLLFGLPENTGLKQIPVFP